MYKMSGLSLLELLIVLALIALICGFGLPLTTHWYRQQYAFIMQKDIEQAVNHAYQESIILGETLRLMPYRDQDWSTGLRLVRMRDTQATIGVWPWYNRLYRVVWHGFLSDDYFSVSAEPQQAAQNGYFLILDTMQHGLKIIINRMGRVREQVI